MIETQYYTYDIAAATYLKMMGFVIEIQKNGKRGKFIYPESAVQEIQNFYNNAGDLYKFYTTFRGLKSQVVNHQSLIMSSEKEVN